MRSPRSAIRVAARAHKLTWVLSLACGVTSCGGVRDSALLSQGAPGVSFEQRFTTARLAAAHVWLPCRAVDSSSVVTREECARLPSPGAEGFESLSRSTEQVIRSTRGDSSPSALRSRAFVELRWMQQVPAGLDRARALLERAVVAERANAVTFNDLAVTYVAVAERDQMLEPMLRALDAVERALAVDSNFVPARFNRALIAERLYMRGVARRAWTQFLAVETSNGWRGEAQAHLRQLSAEDSSATALTQMERDARRGVYPTLAAVTSGACAFPELARSLGFTLLGEWGRLALDAETTTAPQLLALATRLSEQLATCASDRSLALAVQAIARGATRGRTLAPLARAHREFSDGILAFGRGEYAQAGVQLQRARASLRANGSEAAARWASYYLAGSLINEGHYAAGDRTLELVAATATPDEPALRGKALQALGVSQSRRGNYERGTDYYRAAQPHVLRAHERLTDGFLSQLLAEGLILAGRTSEGYDEGFKALRLLAANRASDPYYGQLEQVAGDARALELNHAALAITEEMVDVARSIGTAEDAAMALCARADAALSVGRSADAEQMLVEIARATERLPAGRGLDRIRARAMLAQGRIARDPHLALQAFTGAITILQTFENDHYLPEALFEAARSSRQLGDDAQARRWLGRAIAGIEQRHAAFQTAEGRTTFAETSEQIFDEMIDLEVRSGRHESAFGFMERARTATWPASRPGNVSIARPEQALANVGRALTPRSALIEYALLRDYVVIWSATSRASQVHVVRASRDSVATLVRHLARELDTTSADSTSAGAQLFDLLLRPALDSLAGVERVSIVPDRELYGVPFAALWDARTGKYAIERYQIGVVPSASFLLMALTSRRPHAPSHRALVVGDPATDPRSTERLPPLPGAASEAARVAELYPRAILLTGPAATKQTLLSSIATSNIVHFAGHAIFNGVQPELSYLALAPGDSAHGSSIHAAEIGTLRLSNVEVVVLSACNTLSARPSRMGAAAGLAFSFLRAGVSATVSTLWPIRDDATANLLLELHRNLRQNVPPSVALQLAQQLALRSSDPRQRAPRMWAAFTYTGP